ncbi:2-dehydro-3-deoxygalactonokinase [Donghicola sp. XS_ASV15]|uniref:2-dehydro-3-deoxygalactonokinase n=1 Tax=Donghicola sp. XS_ASV15 TaxID=3241295 RepID=UPI00351679AA
MTAGSDQTWIAVDWGTSRLRTWAMAGDHVLRHATSDDGMASLEPSGFEPALLRLIHDWLPDGQTPVLACGMVGARQGWKEAPYRGVPCAPVSAETLVHVTTTDPRIDVRIVGGLSQLCPPDVMRGEEVQIAGFLRHRPDFNGLIILPGTHSKHVWIKDHQVQNFTTHMTGELFAILGQHSILRHSVGGDSVDQAAFAEGVRAGASGQELAQLFSIRAKGLVSEDTPDAAGSRLSGLLIGAELAQVPQGTAIVLIGAGKLTDLYVQATEILGQPAESLDGADLVLAGLTHLHFMRQK